MTERGKVTGSSVTLVAPATTSATGGVLHVVRTGVTAPLRTVIRDYVVVPSEEAVPAVVPATAGATAFRVPHIPIVIAGSSIFPHVGGVVRVLCATVVSVLSTQVRVRRSATVVLHACSARARRTTVTTVGAT